MEELERERLEKPRKLEENSGETRRRQPGEEQTEGVGWGWKVRGRLRGSARGRRQIALLDCFGLLGRRSWAPYTQTLPPPPRRPLKRDGSGRGAIQKCKCWASQVAASSFSLLSSSSPPFVPYTLPNERRRVREVKVQQKDKPMCCKETDLSI